MVEMGCSGSVGSRKSTTTIHDPIDEQLNEMHRTAGKLCSIKPHYFVLEVGFHQGSGLWEVLQLTKGHSGRMIGTETSKLKLDNVAFLLHEYITTGQLEIELCEPTSLHFVENMFDCIYNVNGYFEWKSIDIALREIYRVLRPGCLFLTCVKKELVKTGNSEMKNLMTTVHEYVDALRETGFVKVKIMEHRDSRSGELKYQTIHAFSKREKH